MEWHLFFDLLDNSEKLIGYPEKLAIDATARALGYCAAIFFITSSSSFKIIFDCKFLGNDTTLHKGGLYKFAYSALLIHYQKLISINNSNVGMP